MTSGAPDSPDESGAEGRRFGRTTGGSRALRELTLDTLRRAGGPLPLAEVASRVVTGDNDGDSPPTGRDEVQRVYLALVRDEIPRLERQGVVEYSEDDGTLALVGPGTP